MANVLVVIELSGGQPLPTSLEALGQARRVSTQLGATLFAVVPLERAPTYGEDDLIATLAARGADKVVLVTDDAVGKSDDTLRWGTHGAALGLVSDLLSPSLLLFAATAGAREVAPRAAARMGAAYLCEAWLEVREERLALWEGCGETAESLEGDLEFPVVATVPAGRYTLADGDEEAEVEMLAVPPRTPDFVEVGSEPDGRPALVIVPEGAGALGAAAEELAGAIGGTLAPASRPAVARLVVSLGAAGFAAGGESRVVLGGDAAARAQGDYAVEGDPAELARTLARALVSSS